MNLYIAHVKQQKKESEKITIASSIRKIEGEWIGDWILGVMSFHPAVLVKNEVILGVDRDLVGGDDKSDFSCFLFLFLRGEEGGGGVVGCCVQRRDICSVMSGLRGRKMKRTGWKGTVGR